MAFGGVCHIKDTVSSSTGHGSTYPGVAAEPGRRAEGHHGEKRHDLQPPHVQLRVPWGVTGQAPSCRGQGAEQNHLGASHGGMSPKRPAHHAGRTCYPIARGAEFSPPMFFFLEHHQQTSIRHPSLAILGPDMLGHCKNGISLLQRKALGKCWTFLCHFDLQRRSITRKYSSNLDPFKLIVKGGGEAVYC